jgi:hypothetical protein
MRRSKYWYRTTHVDDGPRQVGTTRPNVRHSQLVLRLPFPLYVITFAIPTTFRLPSLRSPVFQIPIRITYGRKPCPRLPTLDLTTLVRKTIHRYPLLRLKKMPVRLRSLLLIEDTRRGRVERRPIKQEINQLVQVAERIIQWHLSDSVDALPIFPRPTTIADKLEPEREMFRERRRMGETKVDRAFACERVGG